jgi:PAS domain S-box-containing protein
MDTTVFDGAGTHYLENEFRELMSDPATSFFLDEDVLDGFWYWDLTRPEHEWRSPGFWRSLGIDPSTRQHLSSEGQALIFPEDGRAAMARLQRHCEDPKIPYDQMVRYQTADGGTIMVRCQGTAIREDGVPTRMLGVHTIVQDSRNNEMDRQMSQLVEMSADAIVVWSSKAGIVRWNDGAAQLFGIGEAEAKGQDPNRLTKAEYHTGWDSVQASLADGQEWSGEVHRERLDGSICVTSSRLQRLVVSGDRTLFLQIDRDISERHANDAKQAIQSRELNHRVKNLFSVIQGLVGLSSRHETDVRQFGDKIVARIKALAAAHLLGMDDQSEGAIGDYLDIRDLVSVILNPYWAIVERSSSDGPSIHLPKRVINPLALILHELATNAIKHGAWSPRVKGKIIINWRLLPSHSNAKILELNWRETVEGTKMPNENNQMISAGPGFGSKLIDMSVRQLDASLKKDWTPRGLNLCLSFIINEQAG